MLAVCIQHEMDHLEGKVFVELSVAAQAEPHTRQAEKAGAQGGLGPPRPPTPRRLSASVMRPGTALARADQPMKLVFAGTPEFAAIALAALLEAGHEIALVLTQPDRPAGRGLQSPALRGQAARAGQGTSRAAAGRARRHVAAGRQCGRCRRGDRRCRLWTASCRPQCLQLAAAGLPEHSRLPAAALARGRAHTARAPRRATPAPASPSCRWTPGSTPGPYCCRRRCRSRRTTPRARCTTSSPHSARGSSCARSPRASSRSRRMPRARPTRGSIAQGGGADRLAAPGARTSSGRSARSIPCPAPKRGSTAVVVKIWRARVEPGTARRPGHGMRRGACRHRGGVRARRLARAGIAARGRQAPRGAASFSPASGSPPAPGSARDDG